MINNSDKLEGFKCFKDKLVSYIRDFMDINYSGIDNSLSNRDDRAIKCIDTIKYPIIVDNLPYPRFYLNDDTICSIDRDDRMNIYFKETRYPTIINGNYDDIISMYPSDSYKYYNLDDFESFNNILRLIYDNEVLMDSIFNRLKDENFNWIEVQKTYDNIIKYIIDKNRNNTYHLYMDNIERIDYINMHECVKSIYYDEDKKDDDECRDLIQYNFRLNTFNFFGFPYNFRDFFFSLKNKLDYSRKSLISLSTLVSVFKDNFLYVYTKEEIDRFVTNQIEKKKQELIHQKNEFLNI